jgi:hypothetical protein
VLSNEHPKPKKIQVQPVPDVLAYHVEVAYQQFSDLLASVVEKNVIPDPLNTTATNKSDFRLEWEATPWEDPRRRERAVSNAYGLNRPMITFQRQAGPLQELIHGDLLERADRRLTLKKPAYKDLSDLLSRLMPGHSFSMVTNQNQVVQFLAPLPFDIDVN